MAANHLEGRGHDPSTWHKISMLSLPLHISSTPPKSKKGKSQLLTASISGTWVTMCPARNESRWFIWVVFLITMPL